MNEAKANAYIGILRFWLLGCYGVPVPVPVLIGWKAGNNLDRPPVHHRADALANIVTPRGSI